MTAVRSRRLTPDTIGEIEAQAAEELARRGDPIPWIEQNLRIRTKERESIPFLLNRVQQEYWRQHTQRDMILKARQMGMTTLICGLFFADTLLHPNTTSVMAAHDADSTEMIFRIVQHFWEQLPAGVRERAGAPRFANRREFFWPGLGSSFHVKTAGAPDAGRGLTINNLHCSEIAFWPQPEETLTSLLETVPLAGRVVWESTPNGAGNFFHEEWSRAKDAESSYRPHFYPWWWDPQYRIDGAVLTDLSGDELRLMDEHHLDDGQIRWRRMKLTEPGGKFAQEYPEDDLTCFLVSGRLYFDLLAAEELRRRYTMAPIEERENGELRIFRAPQPGKVYVLAADVAEGKSTRGGPAAGAAGSEHGGPDFSHLVIREWERGEEVACFHGRRPEIPFAHLCFQLWQEYPGLVIPERNNTGVVVANRLHELWPTCVYVDPDDGRPGFRTTAETRNQMLQLLHEAMRHGDLMAHDEGLWREVRSFRYQDSGKATADRGAHDDRVIAWGISQYCRRIAGLKPRIETMARPGHQVETVRAGPAPVATQGWDQRSFVG